VGCVSLEVVVNSDRFATTTYRDVAGWFLSGVINFRLDNVIITSFYAAG